MIPLALGSGRMVVGSEITTSTTEHMAGIAPAPFLRYRGRSVPLNAHGAVHFPGTRLILELWRKADFSLLIRGVSFRLLPGGRQPGGYHVVVRIEMPSAAI